MWNAGRSGVRGKTAIWAAVVRGDLKECLEAVLGEGVREAILDCLSDPPGITA